MTLFQCSSTFNSDPKGGDILLTGVTAVFRVLECIYARRGLVSVCKKKNPPEERKEERRKEGKKEGKRNKAKKKHLHRFLESTPFGPVLLDLVRYESVTAQ